LPLAALLLFGKEETLRRFVPNCEVAFQVLHGLAVEVNDFFPWPLLRTMEETAYGRQRCFDPLQQEQMVLQYVEKHGCITRKEAAKLCRLSGPQSYRLLARLVRDGCLVRQGECGCGVAYRKGAE
jgi:predicted HTH transcriptional regulator